MEKELLKPHWQRLIKEIEHYRNGKIILKFQDGLPVKIEDIEGRGRDIILTEEEG